MPQQNRASTHSTDNARQPHNMHPERLRDGEGTENREDFPAKAIAISPRASDTVTKQRRFGMSHDPPTSSFDAIRSSPTFFLPVSPQDSPFRFLWPNMSSIAAMASRRAFARRSFLRAPPRRFYSESKMEQADLDKGPKRDPELYVQPIPPWIYRSHI